MKLYHYWRSSSSWRVRWALELKKLKAEYKVIDLLTDESDSPEHLARNPMGYIPVLELDDGRYLGESVAIIHWLDETHPTPSLIPGDAYQRARVRQLAELINSGTQPFQNPNVSARHSPDPEEQLRWNQAWNLKGLEAYERLVKQTAGKFSVGDQVTLADLCLIPQCYAANRFKVDLAAFPTVYRINAAALETAECKASHPDRYKPPGT